MRARHSHLRDRDAQHARLERGAAAQGMDASAGAGRSEPRHRNLQDGGADGSGRIRQTTTPRKMTPAERRLWKALRRNALDGLHFRRQQVIEGYIADFYCDAAKLAIELDGAVHQEHCNMTNRAIMRSQASECRFSEFQMRRCSTLSQSLSISDRR